MNSQAAIDSLNFVSHITSGKKWLNINNRSLVNNIITIIKTKNLELQTIKVKAHCGILGNELANSLAKEGSN